MSSLPANRRIVLPPGFRPELVPVVRVDDALPAVPDARQTIAALREQFQKNPVWTPDWVKERPDLEIQLVPAAVLLPIVMREAPSVLLTQRSATLSKHSGQIAFPGGRIDPQDASPIAAALREAQEEVGLQVRDVEVIGQLPSYYTGSGYEVHPIVALVRPDAPLQINPVEVDDVFEVPLSHVLNPANHRYHEYQHNGHTRQWLSMPYQDAMTAKERYIWGVTASILRNLYRFMQAAS